MAHNIRINWIETTTSTNDLAIDGASNSDDLTVWAAEYQTSGRGQKGNSWSSTKGKNLTFSILLKPNFIKAQDQFLISIITTLAIRKYLVDRLSQHCKENNIDNKVDIKWPNDIYIGNHKVCGILIEHTVLGENIEKSIVGIGLNINQIEFDPTLPNPTSLLKECGETSHEFEIKEELKLLLKYFDEYYTALKGNYGSDREALEQLQNEYIAHLYRFGEFHRYIDLSDRENTKPVETKLEKDLKAEECTDKIFIAKIVGITPYACIELELESGEHKIFSFKEIGYII